MFNIRVENAISFVLKSHQAICTIIAKPDIDNVSGKLVVTIYLTKAFATRLNSLAARDILLVSDSTLLSIIADFSCARQKNLPP